MKKIIITMLLAVLALTTAQAGPEKNGDKKKVATEQTTENVSKQEKTEQDAAAGDESETNVTDKVKLKEGYSEYVRDIAENICDDEEKEQFLAKYCIIRKSQHCFCCRIEAF